ncbi:SDR family NAD(P)-dependent oxidoreductase, partial [Streptomyces canarius]
MVSGRLRPRSDEVPHEWSEAMDRPVAVITGATSGLGRVAALDLADRGYRVGVVARSRTKADALVAELTAVAADVQVDV